MVSDKKKKAKNTTRHAKKQENSESEPRQKKKTMETYTKSISMIELTDKDIKDIKNQLL